LSEPTAKTFGNNRF